MLNMNLNAFLQPQNNTRFNCDSKPRFSKCNVHRKNYKSIKKKRQKRAHFLIINQKTFYLTLIVDGARTLPTEKTFGLLCLTERQSDIA